MEDKKLLMFALEISDYPRLLDFSFLLNRLVLRIHDITYGRMVALPRPHITVLTPSFVDRKDAFGRDFGLR